MRPEPVKLPEENREKFLNILVLATILNVIVKHATELCLLIISLLADRKL